METYQFSTINVYADGTTIIQPDGIEIIVPTDHIVRVLDPDSESAPRIGTCTIEKA